MFADNSRSDENLSDDGFSIVIPTLDESGNIYELLEKIIPNAEKVVDQDFEVIFVDDDSKDGTRDQQ